MIYKLTCESNIQSTIYQIIKRIILLYFCFSFLKKVSISHDCVSQFINIADEGCGNGDNVKVHKILVN